MDTNQIIREALEAGLRFAPFAFNGADFNEFGALEADLARIESALALLVAMPDDSKRIDWLETMDGRFANIDRITSVGGKFNGCTTLREAIDAESGNDPRAPVAGMAPSDETENRALRRMLCAARAKHPYMDDGEAQDSATGIDYLRDSLGEINRKQTAFNLKALASAAPSEHDLEIAKSQRWADLDGAVAFHLIERHAESWHETGVMMDAWRQARSAAPSDDTEAA